MADKKSIIAIDIGTQSIVGAKFSIVKGKLVLKDFTTSELLADPSAEAARLAQMGPALREVSDRLSVGSAPVVYSIPGHSVFIKFVKLPSLGDEKLDQIVRFEAEQNVPFPLNEVIWDYKLLEYGKSVGQEVMLAAIRAESLNDVNDVVEEAELTVRQVEVAPAALYNAYRINYDDVHLPALLIDIGSKGTNLIYIEGDRLFTRTILTGGSSITQAIAKEMTLPFATAENTKCERGFVSLGGAYETPSDPTDAALSRVIRNTLTRVHAEVTRTNTLYKQQGGSLPACAFVCGGSSRLGYIAEFFQEKLGIPVEHFDPFRKIGLDSKVNAERLESYKPVLGETVGNAMRVMGACPLELDLVPESVARSRAMDKMRPFFVMAVVAMLLFLGALSVYFGRAASVAKAQDDALRSKVARLDGFQKKIEAKSKELTAVKQESMVIENLATGRSRWLEMLRDLNDMMNDPQQPLDTLWITVIEPYNGDNLVLSAGPSVAGRTGGGVFGVAQGSGASTAPTGKAGGSAAAKKQVVNKLVLQGLYRGKIEDVYAYATRVAALPWFEVKDFEAKRNEYVNAKSSLGDVHAATFEIRLPLKEEIPY